MKNIFIFSGVAIMITLIPLHGFFSKKHFALEMRKMKYKDERAKLMNEILSGIKILKLYAWEPSFEEQIQKIRKEEMKVLKENSYLLAAMTVVWSCTPLLVRQISIMCLFRPYYVVCIKLLKTEDISFKKWHNYRKKSLSNQNKDQHFDF